MKKVIPVRITKAELKKEMDDFLSPFKDKPKKDKSEAPVVVESASSTNKKKPSPPSPHRIIMEITGFVLALALVIFALNSKGEVQSHLENIATLNTSITAQISSIAETCKKIGTEYRELNKNSTIKQIGLKFPAQYNCEDIPYKLQVELDKPILSDKIKK